MNRYALRDDQWERIKDLLPGKPGDVGVTALGKAAAGGDGGSSNTGEIIAVSAGADPVRSIGVSTVSTAASMLGK